MTNKRKKTILIILIIFIIASAVAGYFAWKYYKASMVSNVTQTGYIYIPHDASYEQVLDSLKKNKLIKDFESFETLAEFRSYSSKIKPGRYEIKKGMSNKLLLNNLILGSQKPVKVTFNNIRTLEKFAGVVSKKIELDSTKIIDFLNDESNYSDWGFNKKTIISMFLPNTYEFWWTVSTKDFMNKMKKEYERFWNEERKAKAKKINLTPLEVSVLASIVQAEQSKYNNEKAIIAGLYINRLNKGMLLQSDPTIVFALQDFTIKRVLNKHKEVDSPYNTYRYAGLPPGPINMPAISSIKAVLNYKKNDYIYMCAKEDFSGYHNFAKTLSQHLIYAKKYQNALNKLKIYK